MSNLTITAPSTTTGPAFPTYTFTNSSIASTHIRTTTDSNGDVETVTDITVVHPTDTTGTTDSSPAGPTESTGAGEKNQKRRRMPKGKKRSGIN
ncbi:hypothetical protein VE01_07311 [Pseudogymnoascus verrucosus]|uniref:Uncharacterized protein n=1 Tax=Pseudogymnoascus verrucosus TaxID=342668 RepID=A0A1B8GH75_9PEZI|nr:uncharacterized protein VE01_07311 [Pseudogymnoascus verrucosus]OBT95160.1 hypothetical protein VE01_07311 [Pseudogymnoascus verrucosus]